MDMNNRKITAIISSALLSLSAISCGIAYAEEGTAPPVKGIQYPAADDEAQEEKSDEEEKPKVKGIQMIGGPKKVAEAENYTLWQFVPSAFPTTLSGVSETAEKDTAEFIIDSSYKEDTVTRSCTIKSLSHDITIDAGDNEIVVVLDNAALDNTITVRSGSKNVKFFVQGGLDMGGNSKGIIWDGLRSSFIQRYTTCPNIEVYGAEGSSMNLRDNAMLCGNVRMPYTDLSCSSKGAISVNYISEDAKSFSDIKTEKPNFIGNFLFNKVDGYDSVVSLYSYANPYYIAKVNDGDANCDSCLDMADAVAIMQSLANPDKYKLTEKGAKNADISGENDGVTNSDALAVQKHLLGLD